MKSIVRVFVSFFSPSAWVLIVVGAMLLTSRVPASSEIFVNLPELVTILQLAGGIFILCGFGIVCSQVFWPQVLVADLLVEVRSGNVAAAIVVAGLKVFCGLALIAFAVWLALTSTGLAGVHNG
jgi:hypothetical protein